MPSSPSDHAIVLTGATGFVGAVVLEQLLTASDRPVIALVRAADDEAATARLRDIAEKTWGAADALDGRVTAVAADLEHPGLGLDDATRDALAERTHAVVHCAASVRFDLLLDEARAINVAGTQQMADLAAAARTRGARGRMVHVSTAYVHGRSEGLAREDGPGGAPEHRNTYEQTKLEAEHVARGLGDDVAVVRPSIVVGDAQTGWTNSFNVVYVPLRAATKGLLTVIPGKAEAWLDLVPVDQVARVITTLALDESASSGTFQAVAGEDAMRLEPFAHIVCEILGIPPAVCEPAAAEQLGLFAPYTDVRGPFELARARGLGMEPVAAGDLVPRLMSFAADARWGKVAIPRTVTWATANA